MWGFNGGIAMKRLLLMAVVGLVLLNAGPIMADDGFYVIAVGRTEAVGTKITTLPYTISTPGFYYLSGNLTTSEAGIIVNASDVTLDLMGFCITGNWEGAGITVSSDQSNVEIRNGSIKSFDKGIYAATPSGTGIRVIGVRINGTYSAINLGAGTLVKGCSVISTNYEGITAESGSLVSGNHVTQTGYASIVALSGSNVMDNTANNISSSSGCSVTDNTLTGNITVANGIFAGDNCTITRNTASNNSGPGIATGSYCTITNNTTDGLQKGDNCTEVNNTVTP
jgi:parallel beta-helix repeat protein